jgi:phosphotransferase system enzyme I (PtsP)
LAERYDWLSLPILRFIRRVVIACDEHKVDVAVCGEMGGRPLEAMALIGIGIQNLSITPAGVGPIKAMVRSLDWALVQQKLSDMLSHPTKNFRSDLAEWSALHEIEAG